MQVEDKQVKLAPGMAVTAEIKTGERRIIDYLLSPLRKYRTITLMTVCSVAPQSSHHRWAFYCLQWSGAHIR